MHNEWNYPPLDSQIDILGCIYKISPRICNCVQVSHETSGMESRFSILTCKFAIVFALENSLLTTLVLVLSKLFLIAQWMSCRFFPINLNVQSQFSSNRTPGQQESDYYILRSEKKRLIDSGTSPSDIKIKGTKYVKNVVYGSIVG